MKKIILSKIVLAICFCCLSNILIAQNYFERNYGYDSLDIGNSVCKNSEGGYVIAGFTRNHTGGLYRAYVIKLNSIGDTIWSRTYGKPYYDIRAFQFLKHKEGDMFL